MATCHWLSGCFLHFASSFCFTSQEQELLSGPIATHASSLPVGVSLNEGNHGSPKRVLSPEQMQAAYGKIREPEQTDTGKRMPTMGSVPQKRVHNAFLPKLVSVSQVGLEQRSKNAQLLHEVARMAQMNKPCFHAIKNHAVKPVATSSPGRGSICSGCMPPGDAFYLERP